MTSTKPYLIRAINEWILDNNFTPYIIVNAKGRGVEVPLQFVDNGKIILNLSPTAIKNLILDNEYVQFQARFSGQVHLIHIPMYAVLAIQAKENNKGFIFPIEDNIEPPSSNDSKIKNAQNKQGKKSKANLVLVKNHTE